MQGINKVILLGRVGSEPELRQTAQGVALCRFRVATNRSRRQGEAWVEETDWHDVVLWEEDAERAHRRLSKGDLCTVEGRLSSRSWTDAAGQKHWKVEVVAQRVGLVSALNRPAALPVQDAAAAARSDVALPAEPPRAEPEARQEAPF